MTWESFLNKAVIIFNATWNVWKHLLKVQSWNEKVINLLRGQEGGRSTESSLLSVLNPWLLEGQLASSSWLLMVAVRKRTESSWLCKVGNPDNSPTWRPLKIYNFSVRETKNNPLCKRGVQHIYHSFGTSWEKESHSWEFRTVKGPWARLEFKFPGHRWHQKHPAGEINLKRPQARSTVNNHKSSLECCTFTPWLLEFP